MHPRFLKTFLAVAQTGNITRAAALVNLAQSSVSDQVQALEAELGVELFARTRQGLRLSEAGAALKPYAEEILALTQEARSAAQAAAGQGVAALTIGALETIGAARLPQWLGRFQRSHPDMLLHVKIAGSADLLRGVVDGTMDAAFCFDREPRDRRLARRIVSHEPLVHIGPPAGLPEPAAGTGSAGAQRYIATEPGCIYRSMFDRACAEAGAAQPAAISEVGSIAAIGRLVASGAGRALVPRLAVADMLGRGELSELPWPGAATSAELVLVWRRRRVQPPALARFLAAADQLTADIRPADDRPRRAAPSRSYTYCP
jgi:DNA-binding transcriptional LysR family regulator